MIYGRAAVAFLGAIGVLGPATRAPAQPTTQPVATQPATRPAARPPASTYHAVIAEYLAYYRQALVEDYKRVGRRDAKWDGPALAFLDAAARWVAVQNLDALYHPADTPTAADAAALGVAAVDAGCDDPMVFVQAVRLHRAAADQVFQARRRAEKSVVARGAATRPSGIRRPTPLDDRARADRAADDLLGSAYADFVVAAAVQATAGAGAGYGGGDRARQDERRDRVRDRWLSACCEKPQPWLRRAVLVEAWRRLPTRAHQTEFVDALRRRPDADPWVLGNLLGRYHIELAWDSRGGGWANTVTPERWRGFHANLKLARDHLTAAWRLDPTLPQAPGEMITVAMGGGGELGEEPLDWFGRALDAQVDFVSAYELTRTALTPRWGGSVREMTDLAEACARDPRYDTLVPWQYVETVRAIGQEVGEPWGLLADEKVYAKVAETAAGYAERHAGPRRARYGSMHAAAALRAGRAADARRALDRLAADHLEPDPEAFAYFGYDDGPMAVSEAYVRAGDGWPDVSRAAELAGDEARPKDALAAVQSVRAKLAAADPQVPYLDAAIERYKLAAGEWVDLPTDPAAGTWHPLHGRFGRFFAGGDQARTEPTVSMSSRAGEPKVAVWEPRSPAKAFGPRFEFELTIRSFDKAGPTVPASRVAPPGESVTGGVVFHDPRTKLTEFAVVDFARQQAGFASGGRLGKSWPVKAGRTVTARVRCVDRVVRLYVDGQPVGEPHTLPEAFDGPFQVGLGGLDVWYVEFTNLKYRQIPGNEPPPADGPAGPPRPK